MKKPFNKAFYFIAALLITGCLSQPRIPRISEQQRTYEKDVLPFIIEQLNNTAAAFFYDREKQNRILISTGQLPVDKNEDPPGNFIVGVNEIGGVCHDYAFHFIDNYKGPGEVYYFGVDPYGAAELKRRVKPFEKSDIVVADITPVDAYIESRYQQIINNAGVKEEGAYYKWESVQHSSFFTRTIGGIIYWSEESFNANTRLIPFRKEHIKINMANYRARRDQQKGEIIDSYYNYILRETQASYRDEGPYIQLSFSRGAEGWDIGAVEINTDKNGRLYLTETTIVPKPQSHAGRTTGFLDHAWVRIVWNGMTIDVEPTWLDNTGLERRVKPFERSDIVIADNTPADASAPNYQARRNQRKEEIIDGYYNFILRVTQASFRDEGPNQSIPFSYTAEGWAIGSIYIQTGKSGELFLAERILNFTPESLAGRTTGASSRALVRIQWNGRAIDADPAWYDRFIEVM